MTKPRKPTPEDVARVRRIQQAARERDEQTVDDPTNPSSGVTGPRQNDDA